MTDSDSGEDVYWRLTLPPFASDEPVTRFETATGVDLPQDLKTYLCTVSRELFSASFWWISPRLLHAALYTPGPENIKELLCDDETVGGKVDALQRLCPPGTRRRELFDTISGGVCPWRYNNRVPYLLVYDSLTEDPTRGTTAMRPAGREHVMLCSLANTIHTVAAERGCDYTKPVNDFLQRVMDVTGMSRADVEAESCEVEVVVLCRRDVQQNAVMSIVTSSGPYKGWFVAEHRVNYDEVSSAFSSFEAYRRFALSELADFRLKWDVPVDNTAASEADNLAAVRHRVLQTDQVVGTVAEVAGNDAVDNAAADSALRLPPFTSEEPVVRFETAAGVRLPEDLRQYLLTTSREFPIEANDHKHAKSAMLYRAYVDLPEMLLYETEHYDTDELLARLLPPGSAARDIFDRLYAYAGLGWYRVNYYIPYVLAYADLAVDPTRRTTVMHTVQRKADTLHSLGSSALITGDVDDAEGFVTAILADPSLGMTLDQLSFPSCSVMTLPLSRSDVGYGMMSLVTSEGPYQGWIIGSHYMNDSHFYSGFPSFTQYRAFRDSPLFIFEC